MTKTLTRPKPALLTPFKPSRRKHGVQARRAAARFIAARWIGVAAAAAAVVAAVLGQSYALQISGSGPAVALKAVMFGPSREVTPASLLMLGVVLAAVRFGPAVSRRLRG